MNSFIKYLIFFFIFIIFSTYTPNYSSQKNSIFFPVKEIEIDNYSITKPKKIINELDYLLGKSILFIDKNNINLSIKKFDFIDEFKIKRIYPNTLKFIIEEKEPIAIFIDKKNTFYLTAKGETITFLDLKRFDNLPYVIGKKDDFANFYLSLKKSNFEIEQVSSFQYFEVGRWDIVLKNKKVIKLPVENYLESINNFILLKNDKNFDDYQIFDYRIRDQLILK
tara:strand:- start:125 stop:793 length:669 start_codon:yes stop_codon:yes gene_type:complete